MTRPLNRKYVGIATPPVWDQPMATGNMHRKFGEVWIYGPWDRIAWIVCDSVILAPPCMHAVCVCLMMWPRNSLKYTITTTTNRFNGLFSRTTWVSWYHKGKISVDLSETRDDGALGCKQCAPRSRQITTSTPQKNHSIFTGRMLFLTPNQQCQSTEGTFCEIYILEIFFCIVVAAYAVEFWICVVRQRWRCSKGHQWEGLYSLCTAELFGT